MLRGLVDLNELVLSRGVNTLRLRRSTLAKNRSRLRRSTRPFKTSHRRRSTRALKTSHRQRSTLTLNKVAGYPVSFGLMKQFLFCSILATRRVLHIDLCILINRFWYHKYKFKAPIVM